MVLWFGRSERICKHSKVARVYTDLRKSSFFARCCHERCANIVSTIVHFVRPKLGSTRSMFRLTIQCRCLLNHYSSTLCNRISSSMIPPSQQPQLRIMHGHRHNSLAIAYDNAGQEMSVMTGAEMAARYHRSVHN